MRLSLTSLLSICISLTALSGCNESNQKQFQNSKPNQVESKLTLNMENQPTSITSTNSSLNVKNTPYMYTQSLSRLDNGQFEKVYELLYEFSAHNINYLVRVNYENLNQAPTAVQFYRYLPEKEGEKTIEEHFYCYKDSLQPCIGVTLQLDPKTGHTLLKMQNTQLTAFNENKILLNGDLSGELAQAPYQINIKPQLNYQLNMSRDDKFIDPQKIDKTKFTTLTFTNHNKALLSTSNHNTFRSQEEIDVHILDGKISTVTLYNRMLQPDFSWSQNKPDQLTKASYNPETFEINFNTLMLDNSQPTSKPAYLKGSIGP